MPGWPTVMGSAALGAFAYQRAQEQGVDGTMYGIAKTITGLDLNPSSSGRSHSSETHVLQSEVERLHKLLSESVRSKGANGYTVIHSGRNGWSVVLVPTVLAGGALYLYCRLTGKSVFDLFFVTNRSLSEFKASVTESIKVVWEEMKRQKDEVLAKVGLVGTQQEKLMKQQEEMDERLREVSHDVLDVRYTADAIRDDVGQLRDEHKKNMLDVRSAVEQANTGIMYLCQAVAEVTRRVGLDGHKSTAMLHAYVESSAASEPARLVSANGESGLRMLLGSSEDAVRASTGVRSTSEPSAAPSGDSDASDAQPSSVREERSASLPPLLTVPPGGSKANGSLYAARSTGLLGSFRNFGSGKA